MFKSLNKPKEVDLFDCIPAVTCGALNVTSVPAGGTVDVATIVGRGILQDLRMAIPSNLFSVELIIDGVPLTLAQGNGNIPVATASSTVYVGTTAYYNGLSLHMEIPYQESLIVRLKNIQGTTQNTGATQVTIAHLSI
jgi:hypothetical protein